ncbi:signal peptidase I [Paenibacillus ferrarius]|uniref:signal peptidase I n=1 Tax=Paenibacillus ferrarius TaxID=1469647 RepID=UPI003D27A2B9
MNRLVSTPEQAQEARGYLHELWDWTKSILVALLVVMVLHAYGFNIAAVRGHSMQPTLQDGEWLFVNKAITHLRAPKRGEVIILEEPLPEETEHRPFLVKRVVAVAGDEVMVRNGLLYVNGEHVAEPYADTPIEDGDYGPTVVGAHEVFVMGDNRHALASADSRSFGVVSTSLVEGRADYIMWPLREAQRL